jgi:hypothetical protein
MCTRPTPSHRSVSASASALGISALNALQALAFLLIALVTAPVRQFVRSHGSKRIEALAHVDVQVHLGDPVCVAELEATVWKTLSRAQQTWAPLLLPLDRVVVGAGFPPTGRADIYDDFLEVAETGAGGAHAARRRVVVSLGVRDGARDLDGWEIAGALAAQIQALVDERCRQHRSLSVPAAVVAQATIRVARPTAVEGVDPTGVTAAAPDGRLGLAACRATTTDARSEEVPSLADLLATVQKGQPLVAAGPSSNGTHL